MKHITSIALVLMFGLLIGCNDAELSPVAELKSQQDSVSYAYGVQMAELLKQQTQGLDVDIVAAAVRDALENNAQMTPEQCQEVIVGEQQRHMEDSKKEGEAFLQNNASKEGVMTTASGLQYKHIVEGSGQSPNAQSTVKIHYTGKFIDGRVFDSSVGGDPLTYPLNGFIPGWIEGVQLMKPGGKIELYVPSNLAYGERGAAGAIPPNSTLIFEIELISFE